MMPLKLRIMMFVISLILIVVVLYFLKKEKLSVKHSIIWFFSGILLLMFSLFPGIFETISGFLGFELSSNMLLYILIGILLFVTMALTLIVSELKGKIHLLTQEVSLIKYSMDQKK